MPDLELIQTLDDTTIFATIWGTEVTASVDLTCDDVILESRAFQTNRAMVSMSTAEARLLSLVVLEDRPDRITFPAKIYNLTGPVRQFGAAILCFVGPPWRTVEWRILEGSGTLTPFTTFSDELGRCSCRYDSAGFIERVVIGAAFVP